jgi:hypothetical protein
VDVVALVGDQGLVKAKPLPPELVEAIEDVAAVRGLPAQWMNPGPADLMDFGLPEGFVERLSPEVHGGLTVLIADRLDLICMKLYAVADQGRAGRHVDDLRALDPTEEELHFAARWCRAQDPSSDFSAMLDEVLRAFGAGGSHGDE